MENNQEIVLPLIVVKGNHPNLLGRNWLDKFHILWSKVQSNYEIENTNFKLNNVLDKYPRLFDKDLGSLVGTKATNFIDPSAHPQFFRAGPLAYAYQRR